MAVYKLATDGIDTYGFTGTEWEVVVLDTHEPGVQDFLDHGVLSVSTFDGLPANSHLLVYDSAQADKDYSLNIDSSPTPQVVTMQSGISLPFNTEAEDVVITKETTGGGDAEMTDWKQSGNKVKVENTLTKPARSSTASVSEIAVPFKKKTPDGGGGGDPYELPQATETELGGVKAKERTTETSEIAIDPETGKLYGPAAGQAENGLPAGGDAGQILSKTDDTDYNAEWIDAPSGGGETAYETAQAGGYTGTLEEFQIDLASIENLAAAIESIVGE